MRGTVFGALVLASAMLLQAPAYAKEPDEAALKKKLNELEDENEKLREKLAKAKQDTKKLFDEATRAEKGAGLEFKRPTAVAAPSTAAATPPVGGAPGRHALVRFDKAELDMTVTFGAPRTIRTWRVHDAACEVTRKNR